MKSRSFLLNDRSPIHLYVRDTSPPESVTRLYSVVADYGWAERILCSESYRGDANTIASILGLWMGIPVSTVKELPA